MTSNPTPPPDLTGLPIDVFLLIVLQLSPRECVLCRRVSRPWNLAFTRHDVSRHLMARHFPRSREMRLPSPTPAWHRHHVARRYHFLRSANPRRIDKVDIASNLAFCPVEPWSRFLTWNGNIAIFQHPDSAWAYDDALLVYPSRSGLVACDLECGQHIPVAFDATDRIIRRLRLAHSIGKLLIVEWCERNPIQTRHAHYATAFDVRNLKAYTPYVRDIIRHSEWSLHRPGISIDHHDRFFSAHTATHYALYVWQQNCPLEDPFEQLTIWDISTAIPIVTSRFSQRRLDALGIRQGATPSLSALLLDEANVYFHEEEHRWLAGPQSSPSPPRHHHVRCTGFPFLVAEGPRWFDECCAEGDLHMSFCPRARSTPCIGSLSHYDHGRWPGYAPCWRHEEFPYLTVCDVVDSAARIARQCFIMEALSAFLPPKISLESDPEGDELEVRFPDNMWQKLLSNGQIAGDERWVVGDDVKGRITIVRF
ncbi:hypothetical protein GGR57DRAFT_489404 [Xylariaceae sp. FL1272]|nr:hypothetical protein GGR57DRAFT_489404 [Xylariaceae sp. FL1272]